MLPAAWQAIGPLALLLLLLPLPSAAGLTASGGTGFFLGGAEQLVTAAHVVAACGAITVTPEGAGVAGGD